MDSTSINNIKLTSLEYASSRGESSDSNLQENETVQVNYDYVVHSINVVVERLLAMPKGSWVFFDLDDTLLTADYNLVEEEMRTLISDLKKKDIYVLSLTRRNGNDKNRLWTMNQLGNVGVVFSRIFPENEDKSYILLKEHEQGPGVLENGVAFASDFGKESILQELLKLATQLNMDLPSEIALIDDLIENISSVKEFLKSTF
jgi:hypothetical protein